MLRCFYTPFSQSLAEGCWLGRAGASSPPPVWAKWALEARGSLGSRRQRLAVRYQAGLRAWDGEEQPLEFSVLSFPLRLYPSQSPGSPASITSSSGLGPVTLDLVAWEGEAPKNRTAAGFAGTEPWEAFVMLAT